MCTSIHPLDTVARQPACLRVATGFVCKSIHTPGTVARQPACLMRVPSVVVQERVGIDQAAGRREGSGRGDGTVVDRGEVVHGEGLVSWEWWGAE